MSIVNAGFFHAKQELPYTRKLGQNKDFQKGLRFDGTSSFITFTPTNVQTYNAAPTSYCATFYLRRGSLGISPAGGVKQTIIWAGVDANNFEELYFDKYDNLTYKFKKSGMATQTKYTTGEQYKTRSVQRHVAITFDRQGTGLDFHIDNLNLQVAGTTSNDGFICKQNITHYIGKSGVDADCFFNGVISYVHIHEFNEVTQTDSIEGPRFPTGFRVGGLAPIIDYRNQNNGNVYLGRAFYAEILHYPSTSNTFNTPHDNDILLRFLDSSNLNKDYSYEESLAADNDADTINNNTSMVSLSNIIAGRDDILDTPFNSFCVLDSLNAPRTLGGNSITDVVSNLTIREGGVQFKNNHASAPQFTDNFAICGCYGLTKGKWYWEWRTAGTNSKTYYGFASNNTAVDGVNPIVDLGGASNDGYVFDEAGNFYNGGTITNNAVSALGAGNIFSLHLDLDNNTARFRRNNSSEFEIPVAARTNMANADATVFWPVVGGSVTGAGNSQGTLNFGADSSFAGALTNRNNHTDSNGFGDFRYRPDDGYLAICLPNLPEPTFAQANSEHNQEHFNIAFFSQAGSNDTVPETLFVGLFGFVPDLVILKNIEATTHFLVYDTLRPESKHMTNRLELSNNSAEAQQGSSTISAENVISANGGRLVLRDAFDTAIMPQFPTTSRTMCMSWNMTDHTAPDATGSFGSHTLGSPTHNFLNATGNNSAPTPATPSIQTSGMNAEQYLNAKAQQTMIKYTGVSGNAELGHGLDAAPEFFMVKKYSASGSNWKFWHKGLGAQGIGEMNTSSGTLTNDTTHWSASGQDALSDRIKLIGANTSVNATGASHILYAWRGVEGYSRFGSYTVGATDSFHGIHNPYIWCGFRPRVIWIKRADGTADHWHILSAESRGGELAEFAQEIKNAVALEDSQNINNQSVGAEGYFCSFLNEGFHLIALDSGIKAANVKFIYCAWGREDRKYGNYFQG